jgi:hypothetical protein
VHQLRAGQGGGEFLVAVHVAQDGGIVHPAAADLVDFVAKAADERAFFQERLVVGDKQPPFAAAQVLEIVQAERAHVADGAHLCALVGCPVRLARVLEHEQVVPPGDFHDGVHVRRQALDVHGNDDLCPVVDRRFELGGIHAVGARVNVHKDGDGVLVQRAGRRGKKGKRGRDHLVSRPDARCRQRHVQGCRAAAGGQAVLAPDVLGPVLFQRRDLRRGAPGEDAAVQHLVDQAPLVVADDRPVLVVTASQYGCSAADCQFFCHFALPCRVIIGHSSYEP